ncbi:transposable element Tcb2 transposase [Trichonephila clavipes]|nr:transposable element Tcb2 transposase [Trichonephila clavipes]
MWRNRALRIAGRGRLMSFSLEYKTGDPVSFVTIRTLLAEEHLGSRLPLRVRLLTPTFQHLRLEWYHARGKWTAAEWNQVVFSDKSRFNLSSDDNRICVWRPHSERLNPAFALQRHSASTDGVMVCHVIAYNTWSPLVLIQGTMTAQRYIHDILVTTLPWPSRSPDLPPIEHIWDHLGWRVRNPSSSNELDLQTTLGGCGSPVVKVSNHGRHVVSSSPVPLKTRRVGQRCTLNLSRAETSSRWCGVVVRRGGASSGVVHVT